MGRLQDNQYSSFTPRKNSDKKAKQQRERDELLNKFCPPLDESLARAILSDLYDYETAHAVLAELANEAMVATQPDIPPPKDSETTVPDDMDFLQACFPTLSLEKLSETLDTQDNDLEKTTDLLLNAIYLDNDSQDTDTTSLEEDNDGSFWSRGSSSSSSNGAMATSDPQKKNRRKKKKKTIFASGHLPFQRNDEEDVDSDCDQLAAVPFNYWHQYDSHVAEMAKVLPTIPRSRMLGAIQRARGNLIAAVRDLMVQEPQAKRTLDMGSLRELEKIQKGLATVLTDRSDDMIKQIALGVLVSTRWQLQQQVIDPNQPPSVEAMVTEGVEFALQFDKQQAEIAERHKLQEVQRAIRASKAKEMPAVPEYLLVDNMGTYIDDDPEECRNMAMQLIMERNQLFMKAAEAYRQNKNKGLGETGIAFYYSDEARKLDDRARAWNMRAARALVRSHRIETKDDHLLDLHGLTIEEAKVLLKEGVTQWWSRSQIQLARRAIRPLKVITGVGNHSAHGEARLMPSVIKFLRNEGWQIEIPRPGCILVKGLQSK